MVLLADGPMITDWLSAIGQVLAQRKELAHRQEREAPRG